MKKRDITAAENRAKLIASARRAFAEKGYSAASMDDITADAGLTRGALYHSFGDKRGLFAAVVDQIDNEIAMRAKEIGVQAEGLWQRLISEGIAYIRMALDREVQRIVLLDGPAVLGDPSRWPSQNSCLEETKHTVEQLIAQDILKPMDPEAAARLLSGAAMNAALWIAAGEDPESITPKAVDMFQILASGLLKSTA